MTAQVEFYSTLAGAASVFIGLLAAFIVNRIIDSKSEKKRLKTRLIQIKSEIKNEGEQRDTLHESLKRIADEIGEETFEENANQRVEEFIEKYVGSQWYIDPDSLHWFELTSRYKKYNEDHNNYEIFALAEKFDEIYWELDKEGINRAEWWIPKIRELFNSIERRVKYYSRMEIELIDDDGMSELPETITKSREKQVLNTRENRWLQSNTKVASLRSEYDNLENEFNSIDLSTHFTDLYVITVCILLSVVTPLFIYFCHLVDWTIESATLAKLEPFLVFLCWIIGLFGVILFTGWKIISEDTDLPEPPEYDERRYPLSREEREEEIQETETVRYINESER